MTDFIFVHGGLHDGWCWHLVREELERLGHRTWAPDLPVDDPTAGASRYADVVCEACRDADEDAVVVGHSLGGLTIPLVAQRRPVGRLVFLAASVPEPGLSIQDQVASGRPGPVSIRNQVAAGRSQAGVRPRDQGMPERKASERTFDDDGLLSFSPAIAADLFYHDCPAELFAEALRHLRPQASLPLIETTPLAAWPGVPADYICCRGDRIVSKDMSKEYARAATRGLPDAEVIEMDGGHSPFLARPAELVRILLERCGDARP